MDLARLLDASVWAGLDDSARRDVAARLVTQREGLRLTGMQDHRAFFELDGTVFALRSRFGVAQG